jgi:hypothetical protein
MFLYILSPTAAAVALVQGIATDTSSRLIMQSNTSLAGQSVHRSSSLTTTKNNCDRHKDTRRELLPWSILSKQQQELERLLRSNQGLSP